MNNAEIEKKLKKGISASSIGIKHQMLCEVLAAFENASARPCIPCQGKGKYICETGMEICRSCNGTGKI
jgi:DnaJ-class molecular chaperone